MSKASPGVLTEQQEIFLEALFAFNGDAEKARVHAGYKTNLPTVLASKLLREAIKLRTEYYISVNGPKAALTLTGILEKPDKFSKVKRDVSMDILGISGIVRKAEEQEAANAVPNVTIILPPKNDY